MISFFRKSAFAVLLTGNLVACGTRQPQPQKVETHAICNAIYYWRTTFELTAVDESFLRRHNIKRIYLRMFDVAAEFNPDTDFFAAVPIATTRLLLEVF